MIILICQLAEAAELAKAEAAAAGVLRGGNDYFNIFFKMLGINEVKGVYSFWGRHPSLYAIGTFLTFLGREKCLRELAVENLELDDGERVLDVACGTGRNFPYLERAVGKAGKIIGFDYSEEMLKSALESAVRNNWSNIDFIQGDVAELKIDDKEVDGAISILGLSAVPRQKQAIKRIYEILKPGGVLAVCDAKLFEGFWRFLNPVIKLIYKSGAAWDPKKDIAGEMKEIFGKVEKENFLAGAFYVARAIKKKD